MVKLAPEDLAAIIELEGFSPAGVAAAASKIAHLARGHLVMLAQTRLQTSARDYVAAIQPIKMTVIAGMPCAVISLDGKFPNQVEHGAAPWDLRETLLNPGGKKVRISRKGHRYLFVPFRHMGPNASGKNAPAVGSAYTKDGQGPQHRAHRGDLSAKQARLMGRAVWKAAKALSATTGAPGKKTKWGGRLAPGTGGAGLLRPRHVVDVYAGMARQSKTYQAATQSQHVTFRAISNNPDTKRSDDAGGAVEQNWMHPGIQARNLFPMTETYIEGLINNGAFG